MLSPHGLSRRCTSRITSCWVAVLAGAFAASWSFPLCAAPSTAPEYFSPGKVTQGADSVEAYVRRFEASYRGVRTLRADFTQTSYAWGRSRVESGTVELARGGKMRWEYREPESKLFVSDGKTTVLYVPAERQMTESAMSAEDDARMPFSLLLSHLDLHRAFSKIEFADQALDAEHGDRVLRAFPKQKFSEDYRSVLIELTPSMDVRKLVVLYPDNSTMQFVFTQIQRNAPLDPRSFEFAPPPGTAVIRQ